MVAVATPHHDTAELDYGDAAYTAWREGSGTRFAAETESPRYGRLRRQGSVTGARLDGTLTMLRDGAVAGERWVLAGEPAAASADCGGACSSAMIRVRAAAERPCPTNPSAMDLRPSKELP